MLTEAQKEFCIHYIRCRNATRAYYLSHKCPYKSARVGGHRMLRNKKVQAELSRLRELKNAALDAITGADVVEQYIRIAFADMADFAEWGEGGVKLIDSGEVDGGLVVEISETKDGVKLKLADKMKALAWLSDYYGLTPSIKERVQDAIDGGVNFLEALRLIGSGGSNAEAVTENDEDSDAST